MYKASLSKFEFEIGSTGNSIVNGMTRQVAFHQNASGSFVITVDGKTMEADLVRYDKEAKQVTIRMKGKKYTVHLKESVDLLLDSLGIKAGANKKINNLKAPMPGLIIKILAKAGEHYKAGDPLLILEAMKMENVFKAAADVTIKEILMVEKSTVEKGQVLMVFE